MKRKVNNLMFIILILIAVILEVIGDILFKYFAIKEKNLFIYVGLSIYFLGTIFWAFSLKYEQLSKAIVIFTVLNLVVIVFIGYLLFRERLTTINYIGVIFGIISIILMNYSD